mmetsp:Transcript_43227/g.70151  ORF Transcript_43227/g.70151 Transcript_43227/m.70151 type:complete len:152 (-) Transcript_43227:547-1002(-)
MELPYVDMGPEAVFRRFPPIYWHQDEDSNVIEMDVPRAQSVDFEIHGNTLSIQAERKTETGVMKFVRAITCPIMANLKLEDISGNLVHGMARIIFAKTEEQMRGNDSSFFVEWANTLVSGGMSYDKGSSQIAITGWPWSKLHSFPDHSKVL